LLSFACLRLYGFNRGLCFTWNGSTERAEVIGHSGWGTQPLHELHGLDDGVGPLRPGGGQPQAGQRLHLFIRPGTAPRIEQPVQLPADGHLLLGDLPGLLIAVACDRLPADGQEVRGPLRGLAALDHVALAGLGLLEPLGFLGRGQGLGARGDDFAGGKRGFRGLDRQLSLP